MKHLEFVEERVLKRVIWGRRARNMYGVHLIGCPNANLGMCTNEILYGSVKNKKWRKNRY
jgi:hypothetical protein